MTDTAAPPPTETLAKLVAQKRRVLEQLLAIGRRQAELIEAGDITTLLRLLSAKQQLIAALRGVEQGLDAYRNDDPDRRVWSSPAARSACSADAETCRRLLAAVIELERDQEQRLASRRDGLADQLRRAQGAHAAAAAYHPHRGPAPAGTAREAHQTTVGSLDLSSQG